MDCPCCDRFAKIYKRKLNSAMAYALILLYRKQTTRFLHYRDVIPTMPSRDFGTLVHWGLTEAKKGKTEDGNPSNGCYRITDRGRRFVEGRISVLKYMYLYNQDVLDWGEEDNNEMTTIREALTDKFNYDELMGA